ncbi:MAG: pyridoxamine kinase [Oscillospiraceae bacterium]
MSTKRVLCIQDMSGIGRCSMAVSMPIISAMGVQCCPLATALLSAHTGGFGAVAYMDETFYALQALKHYKAQGLQFDAIYSGYLSDSEQVKLVQKAYEDNPNAIKILDTAMADNGKLYSVLSSKLVDGMRELCGKADIITPNITECLLLLGEDAALRKFTEKGLLTLAKRLLALGAKACVIKGALMADNVTVNVFFDGDELELINYNQIKGAYPGTGDVFASVLAGSALQGASFKQAAINATLFATACVEAAKKQGDEARFGVPFEALLYTITQKGQENA